MAWIALDAGTSVIKAVAFARDGQELALARRTTEVLRPQPAFSEQDMLQVWTSLVEAVREVTAQVAEPVEGIVSTAQGDGLWPVDANGCPVGNAVLWNDGRAAGLVDRWHRENIIATSARISGSVTYPGLPNAILAWLRVHDPERGQRIRQALSCNGWIFYRLTGLLRADLSDASNPLSDVRQRAYSERLLTLFGMDGQQQLLPPIVAGNGAVAPLQGHAARALGLPDALPCVMAPYDIVATAYGVGACRPGQACVILGTTVCAEAITPQLDDAAEPSGTTIALHDGNLLRAMPTLTGCEALDWTAKMLGVDGLDALGELAAQADAGCGGVQFLPYLSPAGERSPFLNTAARGSLHNATLRTTRAELARAMYEGLSFVIRECLEVAAGDALTELRVCGGGARSELWCQMIADVTGKPVLRSADNEIGARGAWLFALEATRQAAGIAEAAARHVTIASRFEPDATLHAQYASLYGRFLQLRQLAVAQWAAGATA